MKIVAMIIKNEEGIWLTTWKGGSIPSKDFPTVKAAKEYAKSRGWSAKRLPECDGPA